MYKKKVCMVGAFAVGKTSLVQRFVTGIFSSRYLTTVGVKIDNKDVDVDGDTVQLLLWDIQGEDELSSVPMNYLKGASAIIYVVDGTRLETLATAMDIKQEVESRFEGGVPSIVLFNKSDLADSWEISAEMISEVEATGTLTILTSSKEGSGVNTAFNLITRVMMGKTSLFAA